MTNILSPAILRKKEAPMNSEQSIIEELRTKGFEKTALGICITDSRGYFVDVNQAYCDIYGYTKEELIGNHFTMMVEEKDREQTQRLHDLVINNKDEMPFEWRVMKKDGTKLPILATGNRVITKSGEKYKITTVIDISNRKETEQRLLLTERVFDNAKEGIIITDPNKNILQVNRAFTEITGYSQEELIGQTPKMLNSGKTEQAKYISMWKSIRETGYWQGELWDRRKNGQMFALSLSITAVKNEHDEVINYLGILNEITEKKQYLQQIYNLAYYDSLTRLPNRTLFEDRCDLAIKKAKREEWLLAVLFVDIDRFSAINDTFGHLIGDELIQKVATRFKNNLREADTISHFSGDKFVVLLEKLPDSNHAAPIAKKLLKIFSQPFHLGEQEIFVTAGIGISIYPSDGTTVQELMRNAESAVHKAKESGKSIYQFYSQEINARSFEKLLLENNLRGAHKKGELFLMYQPQITADDSSAGPVINGMEVLVRWKHQELGLISPGKFIPLAEESGLIIPLGEWIFREACSQYVQWLDKGIPAKELAINLSPVQFKQERLIETITAIIEETGFPAEHLELEITETAIMSDIDTSVHILKELEALGISIAVDDFGTGYSSLNYLKRLPIKKLKIDQSFIAEVTHNQDDATIVSAILSLARNLNLRVIAEGVETAEQLAFLKKHGCSFVQGYYFSPPLLPEKIEPLIASSVFRYPQ